MIPAPVLHPIRGLILLYENRTSPCVVLPRHLRLFLSLCNRPTTVNSRKMMYYLMLVLCGSPRLLVLSLFVIHLGRMGIYFDVSQRNGTPYLRSHCQVIMNL